jgi:hypothetical protein
MFYFAVSYWNNTKDFVKTLSESSNEEAERWAKNSQEVYKDQTFTGIVVADEDYQKGQEKAKAALQKFLKLGY